MRMSVKYCTSNLSTLQDWSKRDIAIIFSALHLPQTVFCDDKVNVCFIDFKGAGAAPSETNKLDEYQDILQSVPRRLPPV